MNSPQQPRIAVVVATTTGGIGTHVASLTSHLTDTGHVVHVCGPVATEELFGFSALGADFRPVEISATLSPLRDLAAVSTLRRAISDADVVHAHGIRAGLVALGSRWKPLVTTWHNLVLARGVRGLVGRGLEALLARSVDVALGVSEDLVARVRGLGARDARFLPAMAPPLAPPQRTADEVRQELGVGTRPLVLSVARLHPQKSLDVLIRAAARWADRDPAPLVAIAGSGPQQDELAELIVRLGAPVSLLGRRGDVSDLLAACDIAVLTSQWEGSPLFPQEALRAGKPLVVTGVGGVPWLVEDAAVVIPAGDVDAVDAAVTRLLDDEAEAESLAKRAAVRAAQLPSETECNTALAALYAELIGRAR